MTTNYHLGYAFPWFNNEFLIRKIYKNNADFPPVVGINGAWRVKNRNAKFIGEAAPWPNLGFIAFR